MDQITKQIFIGDWIEAQDGSLLNEYDITAIVNVSLDNGNHGQVEEYNFVPLHDGPGNKYSDFERAVFELDDLIKQKRKVLVHCHVGRSRSPSVVAAYIGWKLDVDIGKAFQYIKARRSEIDPNQSLQDMAEKFVKQRKQ